MPVFCKLGIVKNIRSNRLTNLLFSISNSKETVRAFSMHCIYGSQLGFAHHFEEI